MRKLLLMFLVVGIMSSVSIAISSKVFYYEGTATAEASIAIKVVDKDDRGKIAQELLFVNDSTLEVYVDFTGETTNEYQMTTEATVCVIKNNEHFSPDSFTTNRIKVRAKTGDVNFRFWGLY